MKLKLSTDNEGGLNLKTIRCWHINQIATTAGSFTITSAKFNTVAVYRGTYRGTLLNTAVYYGAFFSAVPSPN